MLAAAAAGDLVLKPNNLPAAPRGSVYLADMQVRLVQSQTGGMRKHEETRPWNLQAGEAAQR